ncbi:MAG: SLC13 family permease [Gammaproteobacteria bacterium]|nr:SLC13 family permease [Gammaproteobacteria bacterium]
MPIAAWFTCLVTFSCLGVLAVTRLAPDLVLLAGVALLLLGGVLTPEQAVSGFANEAVLTVAVLYVVAAGLRNTGAIEALIRRLFGRPRTVLGAQLRMMLPVTGMSAFMNNTPLVAAFLPAVSDWAKRQGISPSKLMIPLSYAAIFGGTCTLIGTSTNLVVNGLLESQAHLPGMSFFEIAWVGVPCALAGLLYVFIASRWLLPARKPALAQLDNPREYTVEMLLESGSPLEGQTIATAGLRQLPGLFLVEIDRDGRIIPAAGPDERLWAGDRLVFAGITESIVDLQRIRGLVPATEQVFKLDAPRTARTLIEAVIAAHSPMCGKTVRAGRFRSLYNAVVIAVARNGERIRRKIGDIELRAGDTLLLETGHEFMEQRVNSRDFLLLRPIEGASIPSHERGWIAWLILSGLVIVAALGWLQLFTAALLAAGLMIITRCCSASDARRSIEFEVIVIIAAAFGIGKALEVSGAAGSIAHTLLALAGQNPWQLLVVIYAVTMLLTETITHSAAAVIVFPLAFAASSSLGLPFMPYAMAITVAASASFATPIGYATNLMVYGPGGYRFSDYLRFGLPLNLIMWAVAVLVIPAVWPLH